MIVRALLVWLAMLVLAIANGAFRTALLIPRIGEQTGHVVSTVMLSALIAGLTAFCIAWISPPGAVSALVLGLCWVMMTVVFEFVFGHWGAHKSWSELFADYNLARGRIWIGVLLTIGFAPYVTGRLRHLF